MTRDDHALSERESVIKQNVSIRFYSSQEMKFFSITKLQLIQYSIVIISHDSRILMININLEIN